MPAVTIDRGAQDSVVAFKRSAHRRLVLLPQPCRALDIGEQERHGPRRHGHRNSLPRRRGQPLRITPSSARSTSEMTIGALLPIWHGCRWVPIGGSPQSMRSCPPVNRSARTKRRAGGLAGKRWPKARRNDGWGRNPIGVPEGRRLAHKGHADGPSLAHIA